MARGRMRTTDGFDKIVRNNFGRPHGRAAGRAPRMGRALNLSGTILDARMGGPQAEPQGRGEHSAFMRHLKSNTIRIKQKPRVNAGFLFSFTH